MKSLHESRRAPVAALPFLTLLLLASSCVGQSNYASHGNSIEFEAPSEENNFGLPQQTILDGKVTKLDDLSPVIFLNRTKGALNCAAGIMQVELKFDAPFFGIAYADFDRNSACMVHGKGALSYTLELPLKGCGTLQNPQRVFTNNVVVRFHPGLEMDGDEVITVVCRYPPPQAPAPVAPPGPRVLPPVTASATEPPLKGFHILLIICAILFLTLLLFGLGCSYYCLRHRRAAPLLLPPSRPPSSATTQGPLPFHSSAASTASSDNTKLSSGTISMFEGLKIPRVQAGSASLPAAAVVHASTASDTLPSDYPSESLSSEEEMEVDGRRLISTRAMVNRRPSTLSSAGSFENSAYQREEETVQTATAAYSDTDVARIATPPVIVPPKFDVSLRVKRAPPAPPSPPPPPSSPSVLSDVTSISSAMRQQERNLTTILEREESARIPPPMPLLQPPPTTTFSYVPELHPPPTSATVTIAARPPPPPNNIYSRVVKSPQQQYTYSQQREWSEIQAARAMEDDTEILRGVQIIDSPPRLRASPPPRSLASLNTENTDTRSVSEIIESAPSKPYYAASPPPPPIMPTGVKVMQSPMLEDRMDLVSEPGELPEPPVVVSRRPEIISHVVDDVFLRTVTEKRTIEDIERRRRAVTNVNPPPQPPPPKKWDVVIRNYPDPNPPPPAPSSVASSSTLCWERQSDFTDAASDYQGPPEENLPPPEPVKRESTPPRPRYSSETVQREMTREMESTRPLPPMMPPKELPNWDVLIRVLEPPPTSTDPPRVERALSEGTTDYDTAPETDNDTDSVRTPVPEDFAETEEEVTTRLVKTTLTEADREKWRHIITTESTLRTLLTEATVREDFERIRRDSRYQTLFEPHKWDVIIRVLAPPPSSASSSQGGRSRPPYRRSKSTEWDNRSRRSSLPTLYEYDSDTAASSVSTRRHPEDEIDGSTGMRRPPSSPARSRRGRAPSSVYSDAPFSVSEVVVDHSRPDPGDAMSDASGHTVTSTGSSFFNQAAPGGQPRQHYLPRKGARFQRRRFEDSEEDDEEEDRMAGSLVRSVSQPSLARSASEFTEQWAVEKRGYGDFYDDEDFFEDGMSSPRSGRSRTSSGVASAVRRARRQAEFNSQMKHSASAELLATSSSRSSMATREASLPIGSIRMTTTTLESESVRRVMRDSWYDEERKE